MYRNSYVEINLDCIKNNALYFKNRSEKNLIGVVKANGYSTVDYMEIRALKEAGVDFFAVSSLNEALHLRRHEITDKILILGYVPEEYMDVVRNNNFSVVTVSKEYVEKCNLEGINVHLKINTGMNRIGIKPDEADEVLKMLLNKGANVEGIMSHFSSADFDEEYTKKQYGTFKQCVESLHYSFKYIHMSATDGALLIDDDICNYQRIGLGLLGFSSYDKNLKPAIKLYSEVCMVKQIDEGETVSYGRHFTSDGNGYILTLPIGYADGFYRANTGKNVYIKEEYAPIVGSICMDQMMIHTDKYYEVGTKVELFGEHISIEQRADELGTIVYELITSLSDRLTRVYIKDGKLYEIREPRIS